MGVLFYGLLQQGFDAMGRSINFYFFLRGASRSCSLIEQRRSLRIYTTEETLSPHFYVYMDNCITTQPHEYNYMQVWAHAYGTYVSRMAKESVFRSPIYRLIHQLVASIICHRQECDKVPPCELFYVWCLIQTEVCLYLLFALALHLSSMALGSTPFSRICRGHWVTRLALYYKVDTSGMVHIPIRELGTTSLGKM